MYCVAAILCRTGGYDDDERRRHRRSDRAPVGIRVRRTAGLCRTCGVASGLSHEAEKPCDSIPSALLLLVARLENAMNAVSSIIAAGPSRSSRRADNSSVTIGGVFVIASA